jgi:HAE1 family hydrophobic/amphiphilic exporter-1
MNANNLFDVKESIFIGIVLAVFVVFLFLLNMRSTIITGLALPNSLIGAFIFIAACGFSYNTLTLLAMSLAVGLLIDDAIVVRENIFRHLEMGKTPKNAALDGTKEVSLAVIATTLTVMSVFGSMAFVGGITGRFMKEFGFTVVFAMAISLFDGLAVAPMLSAYFSGTPKNIKEEKIHWTNKLEDFYVKVLGLVLKHPLKVLTASFIIFALSMATAKFIPKSFIPNADNGEIEVKIDLVPGTTLDQMQETSLKVSDILKKNKEVELVTLWVGDKMGGNNKATMFVKLVPPKDRSLNTSQVKDRLREQLKPFAYANSLVKDFDLMFGGERPFILNIIGPDIKKIEALATELKNKMMLNPLFKEPDVSFRPGMPELQIKLNDDKATQYGISSTLMGAEIRAQIEGVVAAKYRDDGKEYDVRVRLQEDQRNLQKDFDQTLIPNLNYRLIGLPNVATKTMELGSTTINRFDRSRFVQVTADLGTKGGIGDAVAAAKELLEKQVKIPTGVSYAFDGQAEEFGEMMKNMILAGILAILFIFLVLASLYDSFITPFSIMLALPLALCGAFVALLITGESINLFSIITCIMLFGIATKNSILLVDYTGQLERDGMERKEALFTAGRRRLRPILMTSMALIAGALPLAIGLNEASTQRVSMGIAMIGGVISSTILTLLVVPAAYSYVERLKHWVRGSRKV